MLRFSTDKREVNLKFVHEFLSKKSYWAKGRSEDQVIQSINNSVCFSLFLNEQQIGFACVVTDLTIFAWLMDVFIDEEHRNKGYGGELM